MRAFNAAGVVGEAIRPPVRLLTDANGDLIFPPVPNPPSFIRARPKRDGRAVVSIGYSPENQAVWPTDVTVHAKIVTDPAQPDTAGLWDTSPLIDEEFGVSSIVVRHERIQFHMPPLAALPFPHAPRRPHGHR